MKTMCILSIKGDQREETREPPNILIKRAEMEKVILLNNNYIIYIIL